MRINGGFSQWSHWSPCSQSCGRGFRRRFRECNNPRPVNGGKYCRGNRQEVKTCKRRRCVGIVVNGGYSNWGHWSACSRTCAGGLQNRSRSCTNPKPANGGMDCTRLGPASEERRCNRQRCPG
ncbi:unnamed protein product, partial [Porites evermanni]